jgi:serine/threonine-protein kinase HipA
MSNAHLLNIYVEKNLIGKVTFDPPTDAFSFRYSADWIANPQAFPLSPAFPLNGNPDTFGSIKRFIENLLPEGRALDIVATSQRIAKNNIFGLIREIGRETSGALTFLPGGEQPASDHEPLREISDGELKERIDARSRIPFALWDGKVRLSIAGYQDKLAVYQQEGRLYLASDRFASTHILKPSPVDERLKGLVINEHYCMRLAQRMRLPVARVALRRVPEPVLIVERFDRVPQADHVRRLHVIDSCQALDLPVSYKYERNFGAGRDVKDIRDGVSFSRLMGLADHALAPAVTRLNIVRLALFQYLIGNSDAHGKNLSFFSGRGGMILAPAYDLVSVTQFPDVSHEMAMAFGDEFELDAIRPFDFAEFALQTNTPRKLLAREMLKMAKAALNNAPEEALNPDYLPEERQTAEKIAAFVLKQAQKLLEFAKSVKQVKDEDLL